MSRTAEIIRGTLALLIFLGILGWWMVRALRRSEEPVGLVAKWIITALMIPAIFLASGTGLLMPICGAVIGLVLAIVWTRSITSALAQPFVNLFTGGDEPPEPQALYSVALAKRKKGLYHEAVFAVQEQLKKFPTDVTGQILLAEIQAENLNDLPGAQLTIERLCAQPKHAPENIASALHELADWHLKYAQDVEAARQALEKVIELLPDSEQAQMAAHRIAHLGTTESLLASRDRQAIRIRPGVDNVGLLKDSSPLQKAQEDPAATAAAYIKHLEEHPLDSQAREKLALIYAEHFQRLDMATDQLEQLIQQPNQPAKLQAHWLNLLASLHIQHGGDFEVARGALQRVIDGQAGTALAAMAEQRLARLKLDLKGQATSQSVKLGNYEQRLGLKGVHERRADQPPP